MIKRYYVPNINGNEYVSLLPPRPFWKPHFEQVYLPTGVIFNSQLDPNGISIFSGSN